MGLFRRSKGEAEADASRKVAETELEANDASRGGVYLFFLAMFAAGFLAVLFATFAWVSPLTIAASVVAGFVLATSVRVAPHWERVAILRFGKFNRIAGPGLNCCIPFAEYAAIHVDQRITTASFSAEAALTADLVPVDVDAILFWMVWDAEKACLEVENYPKAVLRSAQTAMRDVIGQLNLADISRRRKQIDRDLEDILGKKCEQWGVTVISVEIRDIIIPKELQGVMSLEAQAECRKNARITLMEAERDVSAILQEVAETYSHDEIALSLRKIHLVYEGMQDNEGTVVVPSAYSEGFTLDPNKDAPKANGNPAT